VRPAGVVWIAAAVVVARRRRDLRLPQAVSALLAASVPAVAGASAPRRRWRHPFVWLGHMWAYKIAYEIPYDRPERLRERLHVLYPLRADRALGAGQTPSERLQSALRQPVHITALDRCLFAAYAVWTIEPHLVLAWILVRHPRAFASAAGRLAATYDATLLGYTLVPTAPPWWASEKQGLMGGRVARVTTRVVRHARGEPMERDDVEGSNPWASMPSDHFGSAAMTAMLAWQLDRRIGAAAWAYALALGFALVYLGEHYVVDLLAGLSVATLVDHAEPYARPLGRRLSAAWTELEPG